MDARRFPWLSGLLAAFVVAVWLIALVVDGVMGLSGALMAAE